MKTRTPLVVLVIVAWTAGTIAACGSDSEAPDNQSGEEQGTEGGACYPNSTCKAGLTCLSNVCVDQGTGGSGGSDASVGGSAGYAGAGGSATGGTAGEAGIDGSAGEEAGFDGSAGAVDSGGGTSGNGGSAGVGGVAGNSGMGGIGGGAGTDGGAAGSHVCGECLELEECWNGQLCVAKRMATASGSSIDATEVTRSQYEAWLSTAPSTAGQPPKCVDNADYAPSCEWPPGSKGQHPVVCVDWCDANAYCTAVGKRLCGQIGGGPIEEEDQANAAMDEWYAACSAGGVNNYPYGGDPQAGDTDGYEAQTCNGLDQTLVGGTTVEVGTLDGCQSPIVGFQSVYDLSGNADEWVDSCETYSGFPDDFCCMRGGSYNREDYLLTCAYYGHHMYRHGANPTVGFRCCSDP